MFNKGEYVEYVEDNVNSVLPAHSTNSVTIQKKMAEQVKPDTFHPPCHKLKPSIESKLDILPKEYASQFAKDETSIGTSEPVSQEPYLIAMMSYQWVKDEIEKLLTAKVICSSRSNWSVPIIVVLKGDEGKQLVINYRALNKVTRKFTWPMPKVEDIFPKLNGAKYFSTLHL